MRSIKFDDLPTATPRPERPGLATVTVVTMPAPAPPTQKDPKKKT